MEKREIGRTGIKVSTLGLGSMNFDTDWHGIGRIDEKTARSLVDMAYEAGVNFIDSADIYGRGVAEMCLSRILKGRRDKFVLSTKVLGEMRPGEPGSGGLSAKHIEEGLNESLQRLGTDYIDLYMPHDVDPRVPMEEWLNAFEKCVKAGKVRAMGCSNFEGREWRECLAWAQEHKAARFEFNEIQFSIASPEAEDDLAQMCAKEQLGVLAWSPLGGGLLSGKYRNAKRPKGRRNDPEKAFPFFFEKKLDGVLGLLEKVAQLEGVSMAQAAIGYVISKPWISSAILGARTPRQLAETLAAKPLSEKAVSLLDRGARALLGR
jgi:aryl-alcohol dehydrogenase-like predicted oxidoreductase